MKTQVNLIILFLFSMLPVCLSGQETSDIRLKDYAPVSIYNIPVTHVEKAKYPVIDMHSHVYPTTEAEVEQWAETLDAAGVERTILLTGYTGAAFDSVTSLYSRHGERFELWCGLDLSDHGKPTFTETVLKELERCHRAGAKGVGEVTDKGLGVYVAFQDKRADGMHLNDPRMTPIYDKCAELDMPLNIHVAEPYWMYLTDDRTNDGLMNAAVWRIDLKVEGMQGFDALIEQFGEVVKNHPRTTFIACHFLNCTHDLSVLARMLDEYPNLYTDISARLGETGSIPRYMKKFLTRYADRILYGTDNGTAADMYHTSFRFLETADEHFYVPNFNYHWSYSGFDLSDDVLKKIYYKNAKKLSK